MNLLLENISISLGGKQILKSITLDIPKGAVLSLLGPSGCGKSTLLKAVAGLYVPEGGTVSLGGENITSVPAWKRRIVILFQDLRLFPHMTVVDNIAFPLKVQGASKEKRYLVAHQMLDKVHLTSKADSYPDELSGGQMQRIALARALAANPSVLLLDEPFSGLDSSLRHEMLELFMNIQKETGITTVLVTHDRHEALSAANNIAFMNEGQILQTGEPQELFERPTCKVVADFFGKNNYIEGNVADGIFLSPLFSMHTDRTAGQYSAMFRPYVVTPEKGGTYVVDSVIYNGEYTQLKLTHINSSIKITTETRGEFIKDNSIRVGCTIGAKIDKEKIILFRGSNAEDS